MTSEPSNLIRAGQTAHDRFALDITPERAGWTYSSLRVLELSAGQQESIAGGPAELLVLPLSGSCEVLVAGQRHHLRGRVSIWSDVTDYLYVPRGTDFTVSSSAGGRFALPGAVATATLPVRYCPRHEVNVMLRGAGACSRQVNNYAMGNDLQTSHLLACEVLTPGGNWSSYPPHKHDEHTAKERKLEEIYYFEVRPDAQGFEGMALQRVYSSPGHPIDVCAQVHTGDVVVMPHGYHGPSVAAPGYDLYYLNVMAGPAEDAVWLMTDDPDYTWLRQQWETQEVDPRLPMTAIPSKEGR